MGAGNIPFLPGKMKTQLTIKKYTNPSGSNSYRLYGRIPNPNGTKKIIRENFPTYDEAVVRRQELEIEQSNQSSAVCPKRTRLSDEQLADAEAAFQRLSGNSHTLLFAVEFLLRNYRADIVPKTLQGAFDEFMKEKRAQNLRPRSVLDLKARVGGLAKAWGTKLVHEVTAQDVKAVLYKGERSPQTILNERRTAHTFFQWCVRQNYSTANIVDKIDAPKIQHGEPELLSLADLCALLKAALAHKEGVMIPFLTVQLFAGLRSEEQRRIGWKDIDLENKTITINASAAKLRSRRLIELTDNALDWLTPHKTHALVPPNWRKDFDAIRRRAGFKGSLVKKCDKELKPWPANALRHTSISFWQAHFKDEGECADRHGTSVEIIHRHYRGLVKPWEAARFWGLRPDNLNADVLQLSIVSKAA